MPPSHSNDSSTDGRWVIGFVLRARGLHGEIVLRLTDPDVRLLGAERLEIDTPSGAKTFRITGVAQSDGRTLFIRLSGVGSRNEAEAIFRSEVRVHAKWFAHVDDPPRRALIGAKVIDADSGAEIGTVSGYDHNGAQWLLGVRVGGTEHWVPWVDAFVIAADHRLAQVKLRPIPGLLGDPDPA